MTRARVTRPPLPSKDRVRVEQRAHQRHEQRAEHRRKEQATSQKEKAGDSSRRARKRHLAQRRKIAGALPRPLRCHVWTSGAGALDREGRVGDLRALRRADLWDVPIAGLLGILAEIAWVKLGREGLWALPAAAVLVATAVVILLRLVARTWSAAREKVPAELSVLAEELTITWEGGAAANVPLAAITGAEESPAEFVISGERVIVPDKNSPATVTITRHDGATIHVETTWQRAPQLAAAVETARGDLAGRRASRAKPRSAGKQPPREEAPAPSAEVLPPPNEAALSALDRDGRPVEAWKQALRAAFTDTGYRRAPPLLPEDLLHVVADARIPAERRIGAALALAERADDELRARLRIASDSLETEALRVAVERAAEGTLEEDAIEEAVAQEGRRMGR